jgi:hypothetical protein
VEVGVHHPGLERVGHLVGRAEALAGRDVAGPLHDPAEVGGDALFIEALEAQLVARDLVGEVRDGSTLETRAPGEQLKEEHAGCVDIGAGIGRPRAEHLRRDVAQLGDDQRTELELELRLPQWSSPKADQLHVAAAVDQDIGAAEVQVEDRDRASVGGLCGMREVQGPQDLGDHEGRQLERERLPAAPQLPRDPGQIAAIDRLSRQVGGLLVLVEVDERGDARVLE